MDIGDLKDMGPSIAFFLLVVFALVGVLIWSHNTTNKYEEYMSNCTKTGLYAHNGQGRPLAIYKCDDQEIEPY